MLENSKVLQFACIGVIALISVLLAIVVYRMFFMFNRAKIEAYATAEANNTGSPDIAYSLLIEGCENILKSQDLTKQVKLLATADNIELERALVLTSLNQCYASGFIAKPEVVMQTPAN